MSNNSSRLPITFLWNGPVEVSGEEVATLADIRQQLLDVLEDKMSPISAIVTDIVQLILVAIEQLAPAPGGAIAKGINKIIGRKKMRDKDIQRIRRATIEVFVRLLRPDLDYTMDISDVKLVCRQVWGSTNFSNEIPSAIYDKVRFSLEGGRLWEYCNSKGLGKYLCQKHRQVEFSYLLYENGSSLRRLIRVDKTL